MCRLSTGNEYEMSATEIKSIEKLHLYNTENKEKF